MESEPGRSGSAKYLPRLLACCLAGASITGIGCEDDCCFCFCLQDTVDFYLQTAAGQPTDPTGTCYAWRITADGVTYEARCEAGGRYASLPIAEGGLVECRDLACIAVKVALPRLARQTGAKVAITVEYGQPGGPQVQAGCTGTPWSRKTCGKTEICTAVRCDAGSQVGSSWAFFTDDPRADGGGGDGDGGSDP